MSITFFALFVIYNIYCADIYCDNKTACIGSINNTPNDIIYARGYKSLYSLSTTNSLAQFCGGALSCTQSSLNATFDIYCDGVFSCANSSLIRGSNFIQGRASNALTYSNIIYDDNMACYGDKSCSYSTITTNSHSVHTLHAVGTLSLFQTTINVISGVLNSYFVGYYAGYNSTLYCQDGTICNIYCYHNGCGGLLFKCNSGATCNITNYTLAVLPTTNSSNQHFDDIEFVDSSTISTTNVGLCSAQTSDKTFDNYKQFSKETFDFSIGDGPICCIAEQACSESTIHYNSTEASVVCSGYDSCRNINIISNSNVSVECSGTTSCQLGIIHANGGELHCFGASSCESATITKMHNVYCTGSASCKQAVIKSSGNNLTVSLSGYESGDNTSILCDETDYCKIRCQSFKSCKYMTLTCNGQCQVYCDENTYCPNVLSMSPTSNPTVSPSFQTDVPTLNPSIPPSITPSKTPTISPSTTPSKTPTQTPTTQTIHPTGSPSQNPTHNPSGVTLNPTNIPSITPTKYPTTYPSYNPTITSKHPTETPSINPTISPSNPTLQPTNIPSISPSTYPTISPTNIP
eukprot:508772_1